jgi:hypothetical protein
LDNILPVRSVPNGDDSVRTELERPYLDAKKRPETLKHFKGAAQEHVNA